MAQMDPRTAREYQAAWDMIARGLGDLGSHIPDLRGFLGDRAALQLLRDFPPAEVVIATGIAITDALLGDDGRRDIAAYSGRPSQPLSNESVMLAVIAAHHALIATEGDTGWRVRHGPDARERRIAGIKKLIDAERDRQ